MASAKKSNTTKATLTNMGLTFSSANQASYPVAYSNDVWDVVSDANLKTVLEATTDGQYTQSDINVALAGKVNSISQKVETVDFSIFELVDKLDASPAQGKENKIHLVKSTTSGKENVYVEYIWVKKTGESGAWEKIGEYKADINTSEFITKPTKDGIFAVKQDDEKIDLSSYLKTIGNQMFSVSTTFSPESPSYDGTTQTSYTDSITATVICKFGDSSVDATPPSGWTKSSTTGVYTKSGTSIAEATFSYTKDGNEYTKTSSGKSATVYYPAWYGYFNTNVVDDANIINFIKKTTTQRVVSRKSETETIKNTTGSAAYLWIITHGSATLTQSGSKIIGNATNKTIKFTDGTPSSSGTISVSDYKVYITNNNVSNGGELTNAVINITL